MIFNEDSRVKVPAINTFVKLGYNYVPKQDFTFCSKTNINLDTFRVYLKKINCEEKLEEFRSKIYDLSKNNIDKGEEYYRFIYANKSVKFIDYETFSNNIFEVVSELSFKGKNGSVFRPDITLFVNGIPFSFLEVKKPYNQFGIQAEKDRHIERLKDDQFFHFFNIIQFVSFSNNMDYSDDVHSLQGSFYCVANDGNCTLNRFREEEHLSYEQSLTKKQERVILNDNFRNLTESQMDDFKLDYNTPISNFIKSLYSFDRIKLIVQYGLIYVKNYKVGIEKHVIRYPQLFALNSTEKCLENGMKRGIIWHTQGSGKTALSTILCKYLKNYYQKKDVITKFYFIVDRLDLLNQAKFEYNSRGFSVIPINSKADFKKNISQSIVNIGKNVDSINIVNIQKFDESTEVSSSTKNIQRIYFLDEVHRGYKPKGTFLSNLIGTDTEGIFIGLTGTPLISTRFKSTDLFSRYIHKYFYNKSILDGYTLKIRKNLVQTKLLNINKDGTTDSNKYFEEKNYISEIARYIETDLVNFRHEEFINDKYIGGLVVCRTSKQAKLIYEEMNSSSQIKAGLILYDQSDCIDIQNDFKLKENSKYDILIVYNMLLTGFDSARLKKLYLLRNIKEHSLLQTLARVNRPYKFMKYGYIVDFADIEEEFEETNRRYLEELTQSEQLALDDINEILIDTTQLQNKINELKNELFVFWGNITTNLENFSTQVGNLDKEHTLNLRKTLTEYTDVCHQLRMSGQELNQFKYNNVKKALNLCNERYSFFTLADRIEYGNNDDVINIDSESLKVLFINLSEEILNFYNSDKLVSLIDEVRNSYNRILYKEDKEIENIINQYRTNIKLISEISSTQDVEHLVVRFNDLKDKLNTVYDKHLSVLNLYNMQYYKFFIHYNLISKFRYFDNVKAKAFLDDFFDDLDDISVFYFGSNIVKRKLGRMTKKHLSNLGIQNITKEMTDNILQVLIKEIKND